jgi:hypothetical protein
MTRLSSAANSVRDAIAFLVDARPSDSGKNRSAAKLIRYVDAESLSRKIRLKCETAHSPTHRFLAYLDCAMTRVPNSLERISLALLAAAAVPATSVGLLANIDQLSPSESRIKYCLSLSLIAFIVALAHAVVLGLPTYFLVNRLSLTHWWMSIICGFIIGTLPIAISSWSNMSVAKSLRIDEMDNGVYLVRNGVLTMAWWCQDIRDSSIWGVFGIIGAFSAWLVWRYFPTPSH